MLSRFITRILVPLSGIVFFVSIVLVDSLSAKNESYVDSFSAYRDFKVKSVSPIRVIPTASEDGRVNEYRKHLNNLRSYQYVNMVKAVDVGEFDADNLGIVLAAIIWKESSFGINITNTNDGEHGSFGIAQILLDTAASREGVKTHKQMQQLKLNLLNDVEFNLSHAIAELEYWMEQHKKLSGNPEKYWRHIIASYNNGWKSYNGKGKKYADDVIVRIKALYKFFMLKDKKLNKAMDSEIERISAQYR